MNVLLIYPRYPETFWSFKGVLSFVSKKAAFPPLGLITVASMMPKEWKKKVVDVNIEKLEEKDIQNADMIFMSAMIVQKESCKKIIAKCKSMGKKVVCGGPLFTTGHKDFDANHFVLDEAEITFPMFLEDLKKGELKKVYTSKERPDITKTPLPSWELINLKDYATMPVQYSRGCPFNCEFCDIIVMNGRVPRTKNVDQMLMEFQVLYDAGWRGQVFIVDDNFIGNKAMAKEMLKSLIMWQKKYKFPFKFMTEASTNLSDDIELMQLMSAANFGSVFLGIETTNLESLQECGKYQNTNKDLKESVQKIQSHGMQVMGGFIVGFDNDKDSVFEAQIEFIQKAGIVTAMVGLLNALPQTRLWNRLKDEKRLVSDFTGENTDLNINFIPKMDKDKLLKGYKKLLTKLYSRKHYYKRIGMMMKNFKPTVKEKMSFLSIKAFVKSVWKIGIVSNDRFHYWWLLTKTFFTKTKSMNTAIELAIHRQHFARVVARLG